MNRLQNTSFEKLENSNYFGCTLFYSVSVHQHQREKQGHIGVEHFTTAILGIQSHSYSEKKNFSCHTCQQRQLSSQPQMTDLPNFFSGTLVSKNVGIIEVLCIA